MDARRGFAWDRAARGEHRARRKAARSLRASSRGEAGYVLALVEVMRGTARAVLQVVEREHLAGTELRHDDLGKGFDEAFVKRLFEWQRPRIEAAFGTMAGDVEKKAAGSLSLIGIDPRHVVGLAPVIDQARADNVGLIRGASRELLDQVRGVLEDNVGQRPEKIRALLEERAGVSRSRAQLIARDQTLKLNSAIVQHRARSVGVTTYQWSGALDERERPMHRELEGEAFSWDAPPVTNEDGDRNHPGEDYQCRCVPLPVIDDLEGGEGGEGGEGVEGSEPSNETGGDRRDRRAGDPA